MKNTTLKSTITLTLLSLFSIFFFLPKNVFADGVSLKISPSLLEIRAKTPANISTPFTIENDGNQPVNLAIGYKPFNPQASQNGNVIFLGNNQPVTGKDRKIFQKIQIVDNNNNSKSSVAIGPKQSIRLNLHITLPPKEPISDYYFSLIFLQENNKINQKKSNSNNKDQSSLSTLQTGIGINILLSVGYNEFAEGNITNFKAPLLVQNGPVPFTLTVSNEGQYFISPSGT